MPHSGGAASPPPPPCPSGWSPKCGHRPQTSSSMVEPWPSWNIRPQPGRQHWSIGSTAADAAAVELGSPSAGASAERLRGDRRSAGAGTAATGTASKEAMAAARRPASAVIYRGIEAHTCCSNRIRSSLFERMDLRPCSSTCKYLQVLGHRLSNKYLGSFSWVCKLQPAPPARVYCVCARQQGCRRCTRKKLL